MPIPRSLAFAAALFAAVWISAADAATGKPNVVLIMVDDLGYHDLGCYGHPSIKTPVLDRLAASGVRLTSFYAGATVCTPSRMALMTGCYPPRHGWTQGVIGFKMGLDEGLRPEALTIAEVFQSAGYATGISGKWHLGNQPEMRPHRQGFDSSYYSPLSNNQTNELWRGDEVAEKPFDNRRLTEQFTAEAIRFIEAQKDRSFFLYIPYTAPHFPVQPHPDWKGRSAFGAYGDVVEELDSRIGQILETLDRHHLTDNTIVVFLSDNGPNPGEKAGSLPYRGEKWSALEGGTRVPCLVSSLGEIPAGSESDALIGALDLMPTLCRACGIDWQKESETKPAIDGLDVWDTLIGKADAHPRTDLLYWHGMHAEPQAIRVGDWKLFFDRRDALEGLGTKRHTPEQAAAIAPYQQALPKQGPAGAMLFNLRDDPGETADLSKSHPDKVAELEKRAADLWREIGTASPNTRP